MSTKGRKRKSTEQHKLEGTYQKCRHEHNADVVFSQLMPVPEKISTPKEITALENKAVKKAFKAHVTMLLRFKSLYPVDIPSVVNLYLILDQLCTVRKMLEDVDPADDFEKYCKLQNMIIKFSKAFDELGSKFYLTPQVRNQMKLGDLQIINEQLKLQKQLQSTSPIERLVMQKVN